MSLVMAALPNPTWTPSSFLETLTISNFFKQKWTSNLFAHLIEE